MSDEGVKEQFVDSSPELETNDSQGETGVENTLAQEEKTEGADPKTQNSDEKTDKKEKNGKGKRGARREFTKNSRKSSRFSTRPKPEFEQKIINISRVTRVVKGGRRLSFRVDMIIGDGKGRVGLGSGKARDTSLAIQKAFMKARKNLIYLKLTKGNSIPHEVSAKVTSSVVEMMPNKGRGLVAGSTVRNVLQIAGITDVTAKLRSRSKSKLNNAKAAMKALAHFRMSKEEEEQAKERIARKKEMRSFRSRRTFKSGERKDTRKRISRRNSAKSA